MATHPFSRPVVLGVVALALAHCGPMPTATDDAAHASDARAGDAGDAGTHTDDAASPTDGGAGMDAAADASHADAAAPQDAAAHDAAPDAPAPPDCTHSASGTSNIWTCTADHSARQRCVNNAVETEACANDGCTPEASGTNDVCSTSCSGSASGTSSYWTCTSTRTARQRCVSGVTQTNNCAAGCVTQPSGHDDFCAAVPTGAGEAVCAMMQWWNRPYSWDPGNYAISWGGYSHDNDLAVSGNTPVQLRHASRLVEQSVHPWGWMPQFVDTVTGEHFAFLHLHPQYKFTTTVDHVYPAGTLVGYSGGDTTDTGYEVSNGSGSVYSTGAHLCVVTQHAFHTAFPTGTDPCH